MQGLVYTFAMLKSTGIFALICLLAAPLAAVGQADDGKQQFAELGACKLASGQQIEDCRLGYRTYGKLNAAGTNAVLFPTWFGGTTASLQDLVSPNGLVDPAKYFVILVDALGDGVSSSPSNSATQHGPDFPAFSMQDLVKAEYRLATETLHLKHLHAVMGISMGGQQTFEWIADYPEFMDLAIPIVGSPRPSSFDLLIYHTAIDAIQRDPDWHEGRYTGHPPMPLAESILQMQLTSPALYAQVHSLEDAEKEHNERFTKGILPVDANNWLAQMHAILHLDIARGGSMEEAAKSIKAKMLIVNAAQDHLVNPKPALDFAKLVGAKTIVLSRDCGHVANGCEARTLNPQVRAFLDGE